LWADGQSASIARGSFELMVDSPAAVAAR